MMNKEQLSNAVENMDSLIIVKQGHPIIINDSDLEKADELLDLFLTSNDIIIKIDADKYEKLKFASVVDREVTINRVSTYIPKGKVAILNMWELPPEEIEKDIKERFKVEKFDLYEFKIIDIPYHLRKDNMDIQYPCYGMNVTAGNYGLNIYSTGVSVYPDYRFIEPINLYMDSDSDFLTCAAKSIIAAREYEKYGVFEVLKGKHLVINNMDVLKFIFTDNRTGIVWAYNIFKEDYDMFTLTALYELLTNDETSIEFYDEDYRFIDHVKLVNDEQLPTDDTNADATLSDLRKISDVLMFSAKFKDKEDKEKHLLNDAIHNRGLDLETFLSNITTRDKNKLKTELETLLAEPTIDNSLEYIKETRYAVYFRNEEKNIIENIVPLDELATLSIRDIYAKIK